MIDQKALLELIAVYERHGWVLRRMLFSNPQDHNAVGKSEAINSVPYKQSEIDAAWFSRPPADGPIAWELRYLGEKPFALLENLNEDDPDFEKDLTEVEGRLQNAIGAKPSP